MPPLLDDPPTIAVTWQTVVATLVVAAAAVFIGFRVMRRLSRRGKRDCGKDQCGCG